MKVFILGGTGSIGTGLVKELIARSHEVIGLSRSITSDKKLELLGAQPLRGNLYESENWVRNAVSADAVVHVASTFDDDMEQIDEDLINALTQTSDELKKVLRLLYTGGCWLYGETGDKVASEETLFDPLPSYQWMVTLADQLLNSPYLSTAIIHPAMVYHEEGGVFENFLTSAQALRPLDIWGNPETRWPIVERSDLASAYADLLDQPNLMGHFNVSSEEGVYVSEIAKTFAQHYGGPVETNVLDTNELVKQYGSWAAGPTIDQQMSSQKLRKLTGWNPIITDYRSSKLFS